MGSIMSLSHAILASLCDCSSSGYDLAKQFDGSVGFFWKATHQQIYRELRKLEKLNWIKAEEIAQEGRPDKKVFSITDLGKQNLQEWIAQPTGMSPAKEEILVKLFAGYLVPKGTMIQALQQQRQQHSERLVTYHDIEEKYFQDISNCSVPEKYQYLTLRRGLRLEEDWIAWCDEAINFLSN